MRFMMLMYPGPQAETGVLPDPKAIEAMTKYNEQLAKAGVLVALDGLQPTAKGARVTVTGGKRTVLDGPFAETKEVVGGYWILQVASKAEAVAWAERCPPVHDYTIEIRQVYELADFTNISPELAAREKEIERHLKAH
jgi:hypothetical protein